MSVISAGVGDEAVELLLLHVESPARGIGIGRRLIAEALECTTRAGYDTPRLELYDVMTKARQLLHGAGFRHASETPDE